MRTTISMDDDRHATVKVRATAGGRSLSFPVDTPLRHYLATAAAADMPDASGGFITKRDGFLPGVNRDNSAALLDLMSTRSTSGCRRTATSLDPWEVA